MNHVHRICRSLARLARLTRRADVGLGHGDLTTTTRYVKILDEEDSTAADVMSGLLKAVV